MTDDTPNQEILDDDSQIEHDGSKDAESNQADGGVSGSNGELQECSPNASLEQLTKGGRSLRPVDFALAQKRSNCVGRIVIKFDSEDKLGTGFLLNDNWVLTNHHLIPNVETANSADSYIDFNFEVEAIVGEHAHVIQHPMGRKKEYDRGTVIQVVDGRITYDTETEPGSSGSPVFNSNWQLIGLHYSSAGKREHPDTKKLVPLNKCVAISRIIEHLVAKKKWPLGGLRPEIASEIGAMCPTSDWYIERKEDRQVLKEFRVKKCACVLLRGGANLGKTSLANRVSATLRMENWVTQTIDFESFVTNDKDDGAHFFKSLATRINQANRLPQEHLDVFEGNPLGEVFLDYVHSIRKEFSKRRFLLVLDHGDQLANWRSCSDVVGVLRSLVDDQNALTGGAWFSLLILYTIAPKQQGKQGSVFLNCGKRILLRDFSIAEIGALIQLYRLGGKDLGKVVWQSLGGHPYLIRTALNEFASQLEDSVSRQFDEKRKDLIEDLKGFGDNTQEMFADHLNRIADDFDDADNTHELVRAFRQVCDPQGSLEAFENGRGLHEQLFNIGVVTGAAWRKATVRNDLYKHCLGDHLP